MINVQQRETESLRPLSERPIFILCHARSGSTLLRYCLDSHPEIACPPETNLAVTFSAIQATCLALPDESREHRLSRADEICRQVANRTVGEFMRTEEKSRWCEKSLTSAAMAPLLQRIYPSAQFLCLFRECTDVVMSAMEASHWGFGAYGFDEYARDHPENLATAFVRFWVEKTSQLLQFKEENPQVAHSLRYEDLVADPENTLKGVFEFLGYEWKSELATNEHIFGTRHASGRGDYKIGGYTSFRQERGSRGWRVPRTMIAPALKERANDLLKHLGYAQLDDIYAARPDAAGANTVSAARSTFINYIKLVFERAIASNWRFGIGEFVLVDTAEVLRVDLFNRTVGMHVPTVEDTVIPDYQVITDSSNLLSVIRGRLDIATAIHHDQVLVVPSASIELDDRARFFDDFASIFRSV